MYSAYVVRQLRASKERIDVVYLHGFLLSLLLIRVEGRELGLDLGELRLDELRLVLEGGVHEREGICAGL